MFIRGSAQAARQAAGIQGTQLTIDQCQAVIEMMQTVKHIVTFMLSIHSMTHGDW